MNGPFHKAKTLLFMVLCLMISGGTLIGIAAEKATGSGSGKQVDLQSAYKLYQSKCLLCHDSVADPEKPGKTRDGWFVAINVMHNFGLKISKDESARIVDLLYAIRHGLEKDPG
jgi:hypothetical protein